MKSWIVPALALCVIGAAACANPAAARQSAVVPRASGFPSATEYQAISAAATQLAAERSALPCQSVTNCTRTTVFVDGQPISDGFVAQVGQGMFIHDFGGQATAAHFISLMRDQTSGFVRRVLTSAAYSALLRLDAASTLNAAQRRDVEARIKAAEQAVARGSVSITPAGGSRADTAAQVKTFQVALRSSVEEQELEASIAKSADPGRTLRDFIKAALVRHRVEFTPSTGLTAADVLAYAAQAAAKK